MTHPIGPVLLQKLYKKLADKYGENKVNFFIILFVILIFVGGYLADRYEQNKKIKDFCYSITVKIWNKYGAIYPDKYYSECVKMIKRAGGIDKFMERLER